MTSPLLYLLELILQTRTQQPENGPRPPNTSETKPARNLGPPQPAIDNRYVPWPPDNSSDNPTALFAIWAAITGPFRGSDGAKTYRQHIAHAILRHMCSLIPVRHVQYVTLASYQVRLTS